MSAQGNKPTGIKIGIRIFVNQVSGERLWETDKPIPPQMQIAINVNVLGIEKRSDVTIDVPFLFTVNFTPSIAQINIKGKAQASGDRNEINKILLEYEEKKSPPAPLVQAISNASMAEAILISKTIGVPPPLPTMGPPQPNVQQKQDGRYTA
jgi:hypothetical protein